MQTTNLQANKMCEIAERRTEITIETHSVTIIKIHGARTTVFCEHCRVEVAAFAPARIAAFLHLDLTEIRRRIEAGELHLTETKRTAGALVCGNSEKKEIQFNQ